MPGPQPRRRRFSPLTKGTLLSGYRRGHFYPALTLIWNGIDQATSIRLGLLGGAAPIEGTIPWAAAPSYREVAEEYGDQTRVLARFNAECGSPQLCDGDETGHSGACRVY